MIEFRLLGPVEVWNGGDPVPVGGRRERTMLALLLLGAGRVVPVDRMMDAVWGDSPPATVRRQVQTGISNVRRALGELLVRRAPGYALVVPPGQVDLHVFDAKVTAAREAAAVGASREAAADLRAALALWQGPALGGVSGLAGEATRLEERRLTALEERIELDLALGRHADLVGELLTLVGEHPLRERFRAQLMRALHGCGRQADALTVYRDARHTLTEELGLEPSAELRELEQAILANDPSLGPRLPPARGRVATSGAPLAAMPHLLPADVPDFTGREEQVEVLCAALTRNGPGDRPRDDGAVAISAVTGRAGVGKTTLAVRVAHRLREAFPDGQLYVNLHGVDVNPVDPAEVLARFLRALGVDGSAIPTALEERAEIYRARLAGRRTLILLDNARDEAQVDPLLPGSPSCSVLVTSRARLGGLAGARPVELEVLATADAVELLARIAGPDRVAAEPATATELVDLCGGLPLAVRIIGARLAARPHWLLADLVCRLTNEQHRLDELAHGRLEVRASLALSYRALDGEARQLFRRLGLLAAPDFPAWAATAVLDTKPARAELLTERLIDARLLEVAGRDPSGQIRYRFHDLVRVYARECAEAEESPAERGATLRRAFGAWLALAEDAHRRIYSGNHLLVRGGAPRWRTGVPPAERLLADPLLWLETERLAIVAAVRQAALAGMHELAWELAQACVGLFTTRWYLDDWRQTHEHALAATRGAGDRRGEAALLCSLTQFYDSLGQYDQAKACYETALAQFAELGERHGYALTLCHAARVDFAVAAHIDRQPSGLEAVLARAEQARATLHQFGDRAGEAAALRIIGHTCFELARFDCAEQALAEALTIAKAIGDRRIEAQAIHRMAELQLRQGAFQTAEQAFKQELDLATDVGDPSGQAWSLHGLSSCHLRQNQYEQAEARLEEAAEISKRSGNRVVQAQVLQTLGELHHSRSRPDQAIIRLEQALDLWRQLGTPRWQSHTLRALAEAHEAAGDTGAASTARHQAQTLQPAPGSRSASSS